MVDVKLINDVQKKMMALIDRMESGETTAADGDVAARAGHVVVKGEEVKVRGAILGDDKPSLKSVAA